MTFKTKARPLLAALLPTLSLATVTAPAVAAEPATFYAYTAPIAAPAAWAGSPMHFATVAALALLAASAAAFLPFRGSTPRAEPATPTVPVQVEAVGPIYCPRSRRWRDAKSGRLVKAPRV